MGAPWCWSIILCQFNYYGYLCCRESKRKTAAVVALRNDERLFGDAALNTVSHGRERERERDLKCRILAIVILCVHRVWWGRSSSCVHVGQGCWGSSITKQEGIWKLCSLSCSLSLSLSLSLSFRLWNIPRAPTDISSFWLVRSLRAHWCKSTRSGFHFTT